MKKVTSICLFLLFIVACTSDEDGNSNLGNINTLLKEATVSNDTEGTRYFSYDSNYNLVQIKNNVKTITFSYYPANEYNYFRLKSIIWTSGSVTKKLELTNAEDEHQDIEEIILTQNGETTVATVSVHEENWNYLKFDFGSYYELILRGGGGVKEIKKYSTGNEFMENQSYRFSYYEPGTHSVDYGYGRSSDKTWMLRYLDQEEFFKIPLSSYAVNYIETFAQDNSFFRQHSHQFDQEVLLSTKIHQQDEEFHKVDYQFEKLAGKTD